MNPFVLSLIAAFAINALFFAYAAWKKTDVVTDLSYSLSFGVVAAILIYLYRDAGFVALLPSVLTILWAARLGYYLFGRIRKTKVDHRFDSMRDKPLKFARFWILQALAVFVVLLPVTASVASPALNRPFSALVFVGLALWLVGIGIEVAADAQKSAFKKSGSDSFIKSGIWSWSRHPNYFGESLLWWGIFVMVISALSGLLWLSVLGPVFITCLLLFVSGIPLLEKAADKRWGNDPEYKAYKASTSIFVPLPPKKR